MMMSDTRRSYAVVEEASQGRRFAETPHPYRSAFERDRDRIVHCSAFRRLEGKTQVFAPGLDDYYRTRLTHSIEVAQIGRTIAKALGLNESLTEAICLAHDLGHPPFGHAGEQALNRLMAGHGGFEHNTQTLRIVDLLEHPYPAFTGLNLMHETRLGLGKHKSRYDRSQAAPFEEQNCTLEGQVADVADRIAYNCHDLEDGMRARLLADEQMRHVELYVEAAQRVGADRMDDWTVRRTRTAKTMIDTLVSDCVDVAGHNITRAGITGPYDACERTENIITLSGESERKLVELEKFLFSRFYRHASLLETAAEVERWLGELFERLCRRPDLMPGYFQSLIPEQGLQRTVCDYIAGMTDRFASKMVKEM